MMRRYHRHATRRDGRRAEITLSAPLIAGVTSASAVARCAQVTSACRRASRRRPRARRVAYRAYDARGLLHAGRQLAHGRRAPPPYAADSRQRNRHRRFRPFGSMTADTGRRRVIALSPPMLYASARKTACRRHGKAPPTTAAGLSRQRARHDFLSHAELFGAVDYYRLDDARRRRRPEPR